MDDIDTKKLVLLFSLVMVLTLRILVVVALSATEISDNENFLGLDYSISKSVTDVDTITGNPVETTLIYDVIDSESQDLYEFSVSPAELLMTEETFKKSCTFRRKDDES